MNRSLIKTIPLELYLYMFINENIDYMMREVLVFVLDLLTFFMGSLSLVFFLNIYILTAECRHLIG